MTTISAGQIIEVGEKRALQAGLGAAVAISGTAPFLALATNAASGSMDNTFLLVASATEYAATGYARQTFTAGTPTSASPSVIANTNATTYGPMTAGTGSSIVWGLMTDIVTIGSGAALVAFLLTTARTPIVGDSVSVAVGAFTAQV